MAATVAGVMLTGVHGSRPSSGVSVGTLYSCTTHSLIYQTSDTGSTWGTWANLGGTGAMATDALWDTAGDLAVGTGANTGAKLAIGAAGGALSVINSAVAWNSGTSFPGSKATGDRYWRTDLGMEAYWDGTRWLTTQLFDWTSNPSIDTSMSTGGYTVDAVGAMFTPWFTTYDLYVTRWDASLRVDASNSGNTGSHYWTCALQVGTSANSYTTLSGATVNTSAISANVNTAFTASVGQLWTPGTNPIGRCLLSKTGTPGKLVYAAFVARYRLVLT